MWFLLWWLLLLLWWWWRLLLGLLLLLWLTLTLLIRKLLLLLTKMLLLLRLLLDFLMLLLTGLLSLWMGMLNLIKIIWIPIVQRLTWKAVLHGIRIIDFRKWTSSCFLHISWRTGNWNLSREVARTIRSHHLMIHIFWRSLVPRVSASRNSGFHHCRGSDIVRGVRTILTVQCWVVHWGL